jgi:hypothetical protein
MGRLPAGLRGYVRLPLHLTYLKPEAARSLFPRLTDCNQKRSTHFARSQNCLFVRCPSLPTLRPLADAFGARNFLRKYCRNRRGSDNFPATAMGAYERGAAAQSVRSKTAHLPSAYAPLKKKAIVEVVTPIAVGDNAFGRLSSLQRPLRGGSRRGRARR